MAVSVKDLGDKLYDICLRHPDREFLQEDLISFGIIPGDNIELLLRCLSKLCNQRRFTQLQANSFGIPKWKVVQREDVARYQGLTQDESVVLSQIDDAQNDGIWVRHIRMRSGLAQNLVNNALKKLEQKEIVKQITSAKNPTRKHYMLAHLQPSENVTGGPFFADGALDDEFIYQISRCIDDYVARQSWGHDTVEGGPISNDASGDERQGSREIAMAPGFAAYPTLTEITRYVNGRRISQVRLVDSDIKQLLDLLCWDGRIIRLRGGQSYKSVRGAPELSNEIFDSNGFTETPCGRCPVFDWCNELGPVNSRSCHYLPDWLQE